MKDNKVLVGTWVGAILLIGYRSFHNGTGMPPPRSMFAANIVWTLLGVLSLASVPLANALSAGALVGLAVTNSTVLGGAASSLTNANGAPTASTLGQKATATGTGLATGGVAGLAQHLKGTTS